MRYLKVKKFLFILRKIKFILLNIEFNLPIKNQIYLVGSDKKIFKKIIKRKFELYKAQKFNFFVLILLIFKKKFSVSDFHLNYLETYLRFVEAKILISTIDNNPLYWSIKKKISYLKVLIIQNGWRHKNYDIFDSKKLSLKNNYEVDYFFTFNSSVSKLYSKFIKAKFIELGSLYNNSNPIKKHKKNNKILYLSEFHNKFILHNFSHNYFYKPERHLLPFLKQFCLKKNFKLEILPKYFSEEEHLFYKNILGTKNWSYKKNVKNPYNYSDTADLVIFFTTTLGYEIIARKKKLAGFCCRLQDKGSRGFGWPKYDLKDKGFFWINKLNLKNFEKILMTLTKMSQNQWNLKTKKYRDNIMIYNKNNNKLRHVVSKICSNL